VRKVSGEWVWVQIDQYGTNLAGKPNTLHRIWVLLSGEVILAAGLGLLFMSLVMAQRSRSRLRYLLWGFAIVLWGLLVLILRPALCNGAFVGIIIGVAMIVPGILVVPLALDSIFRLGRQSIGLLVRVLMTAVAIAVLFFLPYLLWALGALPDYTLAMGFALVLGLVALLVGVWSAGRQPAGE
jgi:hypothetical protein